MGYHDGSMYVTVIVILIWSNYSDLTRPHPKWWFSKGNPLISGTSRFVKYYNLARLMICSMTFFGSGLQPLVVCRDAFHLKIQLERLGLKHGNVKFAKLDFIQAR